MNTALLLLSPFETTLLNSQAGADAAQALRNHGITRADLTSHPRYGYAAPTQTHKNWAAPDFTSAARTLADIVFRPVLGRSDVCDLSYVPKSVILPSLETLSSVGSVFTRATKDGAPPAMDNHDGASLGLVFHLAIHGRSADKRTYDLLVFPGLSARARASLDRLGKIGGPRLGAYGDTISLLGLRRAMALINTPATTNSLH